jgi:hypothetical protein
MTCMWQRYAECCPPPLPGVHPHLARQYRHLAILYPTHRDGEYKLRSYRFCHYPHRGGRCRTSRLQDYRVQEYRLPSPPSLKCSVLRESLFLDSQSIPCAALKRRVSWVISVYFWPNYIVYLTEYTVWQRPFSCVHSIMMEKLGQASGGGGCTLTPFHYIYHHVQSCGVRSSWERRYTPTISTLRLYVLCSLPFPCEGIRTMIPWHDIREYCPLKILGHWWKLSNPNLKLPLNRREYGNIVQTALLQEILPTEYQAIYWPLDTRKILYIGNAACGCYWETRQYCMHYGT